MAKEQIEHHRLEIEKRDSADFSRVLMCFFQSNLRDADRSGEKVVIESITERPLPLIYASELARQRIKSEMVHGDRNIYKLAFSVDVNVETVRGRFAAYRLTQVHDVIELPEDALI